MPDIGEDISEDEARALAKKIMDKSGAIPGLFHAILPAFTDEEGVDTERLTKYCESEPKGKDLWAVFEASGCDDPCDFIVAHANAN